jgi:hypothetical protein
MVQTVYTQNIFIEKKNKQNNNKKKNSMALVRKRTIPTERPLLVGEVSANFLWAEGVAWSAERIPMAVILSFLHQNHYFFIQVAPLQKLQESFWM